MRASVSLLPSLFQRGTQTPSSPFTHIHNTHSTDRIHSPQGTQERQCFQTVGLLGGWDQARRCLECRTQGSGKGRSAPVEGRTRSHFSVVRKQVFLSTRFGARSPGSLSAIVLSRALHLSGPGSRPQASAKPQLRGARGPAALRGPSEPRTPKRETVAVVTQIAQGVQQRTPSSHTSVQA